MKSISLAVLLLAGATTGAKAQAPLGEQVVPATGRQVMERYQLQDRTRDTELAMTMRIVDRRGRERTRAVSLRTKTRVDGTRMQLVRFLAPADVEGTGFLTVEQPGGDDDAWLYLPALRRVRRIAGAQKQDRFMGTDFTFEDLEPEVLDDHVYTLVREDDLDGTPVWVVASGPAAGSPATRSGYGRRELWISKEHALLVHARLYDRDGVQRRRMTASDIRPVPGTEKWRHYRVVMEDLADGGRTVLEIDEYRIDQGLGEDLFTERYLTRGR